MGYFLREHIFIGLGPTLAYEVPIYWADDLTDEESRTLAASVQNALNKLDENHGGGPWYFELAPSAQEDAVKFVNWKDEWTDIKRILENPESITPDSWESELAWLHKIAQDHANIIREIRDGETPTIYLQCDVGSGYETFDCVDSLTWEEIETLESVAKSELYEFGMMFRIIDDWHAERNPDLYVQAKISWTWFEKDLDNDGDADETRMLARGVAHECIEEIMALRNKPVVYGREDEAGDDETGGDGSDDDQPPEPATDDETREDQKFQPKAASEGLRSSYRDPDNYWRNVWLYEQRKGGKTNKIILAELRERSREFAPLESENALRSAISSIAQFHQWPEQKGRPGRPKASDSTN